MMGGYSGPERPKKIWDCIEGEFRTVEPDLKIQHTLQIEHKKEKPDADNQ